MRLIDADFVCERIEKEIKDIVIPEPYADWKNSEYDIGYNNALTMAESIAKKAPTIEAEPVRHGEWKIKTDDYDCEYIMCSCCKEEFYPADEDTVDTKPNYCPNCGAKMEGKEPDDR